MKHALKNNTVRFIFLEDGRVVVEEPQTETGERLFNIISKTLLLYSV